jgi:hypothetical protein
MSRLIWAVLSFSTAVEFAGQAHNANENLTATTRLSDCIVLVVL